MISRGERATRSLRAHGVIVLAVLAAGCDDLTTAPPPDPPEVVLTGVLRCRADRRGPSLECEAGQAGSEGSARRSLLTLGGQDHYVRLESVATSYDPETDLLSSLVSVQNLLLAPLGTADGLAAASSGVVVFFASGPTSPVVVANPTGTGTFTAAGQTYFRYAGADLGPDGILSPEETSERKTWSFDMNGAESFTFMVYVQGEAPPGQAGIAHFVQVSPGAYHTCAVTGGGTAYCWGYDVFGALGNGPASTGDRGVPSRVLAPGGVTFASVSAGGWHTCALTPAGRAYCWGSDSDGRLGDGPPFADQSVPVPVVMPEGVAFLQIEAGNDHTCAIGDDGNAYCWGYDGFGMLGNGSTLTAGQPSPSLVQAPAGVTFTRISAGTYHTCALDSDGVGRCWGWDGNGELGNGPGVTADQASPVQVLAPGGTVFTRISAGTLHTCALTVGGGAYCWGADGSGQLGNGPILTAAQSVPSPVLAPAGVSFAEIDASGPYVSCGQTGGGEVYCWGSDAWGALGNGAASTVDLDAPSLVLLGPAGESFSGLALGDYHGCARGGSGALYCWGRNGNRQLGDGTMADRNRATVVAASQ